MFDFVRTHQKLMQILLALLIVPSFVLVGVSGVKLFGEDPGTIAKVAGYPLTQQEWERSMRDQLDRMRQQMGQQFDQKAFDTPEFKQGVLDQLIAQRALSAEIRREHLTVSDDKLRQVLSGMPGLSKEDGTFDIERYRQILAAQGMNVDMHQNSLRNDLVLQQLSYGIELSAFAPRTVAKAVSDYGAQEREVHELVLPLSQFLPNVKVTDEMVKAFYDKNAKLFEVPESAKAEYMVLNMDAVAGQINVSEQEVADYYKGNAHRFTDAELRRASHILIKTEGRDKAAAKAQAEAVLAEVRKAPGDFARIAKAKSEDPGSAELGGDLDVLVKGTFVKPVEDAILKLKQGEISDLVESEFGYHILTVTDLKPAHTKPLEEVKDEVAAELKKQKAAKLFSEMSETFTDTVYSQYDSLKPAAEKLKLNIQTVEGLSRNPSPAFGSAPFNNAKFLTALFSDDAIKNKRNTEAVEVAPQTLVAGRIVEYKPASKKPLAEVDAVIRQRVAVEEAMKAAHKAGEEKLAAIRKGEAAGLGEAKIVSRAKPEAVHPLAFAAVMKADVAKLPAAVGVELPGMGYGVYSITKVQQPAEQDQARRADEAVRINALVAQQEMGAFIESVKNKAKVKMIRPVAEVKPAAE